VNFSAIVNATTGQYNCKFLHVSDIFKYKITKYPAELL
jgi:hypothetical protein